MLAPQRAMSSNYDKRLHMTVDRGGSRSEYHSMGVSDYHSASPHAKLTLKKSGIEQSGERA